MGTLGETSIGTSGHTKKVPDNPGIYSTHTPSYTVQQYIITIDFLDACFGKKLTIELPKSRTSVCTLCEGKGETYQTCSECKGTGKSEDNVKRGLFGIETRQNCSVCGGTGTKPMKCPKCGGKGYSISDVSFDVIIPAGIDDGQILAIKGRGRFLIKVREHPVFRRDGYDIRITQPVGQELCRNGGEIEVPCIDGKALVKLPKDIKYGSVLRMRGKGVKKLTGNERGDQYINIVPQKSDTVLR